LVATNVMWWSAHVTHAFNTWEHGQQLPNSTTSNTFENTYSLWSWDDKGMEIVC
jgi:hypothetical protein